MAPLGKLGLAAIPTDPVEFGGMAVVLAGALATIAWITRAGRWGWLWREWLTSLDHKRIGIMYVTLAHVMLLRGFIDAAMMRSQQALATGGGAGYLQADHYDQIFSAHGTIMVFFVAMPFIVGLLNIVVPLQIGARDVSFPYLNALSLWLNVAGAMLVNVALFLGNFSRTGWLAFPPLSELAYAPSVGVDYWIWAVQVAGAGSLMSGINFFVTIVNRRAPGMTLRRMSIFIWTAMSTSILIMAAFPILAVTVALLTVDRYLGGHFFTNTGGGDPMMYFNMVWAWGHPEVYILALPAFGIFSCVIPCFSGKPLFGHMSMVCATIGITFLSFLVWLHHFFTMGAGGDVNGFFGVMTMIIAVPTGVKVFNWLLTMYRGRLRLAVPMLWSIGFIVTFTIGGMTGVLLSFPAIDFILHNSLFLVAHFHNVLIGGTLFGMFAGFNFWFPKAMGFRLDERLGRWAFWLWIAGFYLAFMPLYVLGFLGMTRRLAASHDPAFAPWLWLALGGAALIMGGIACQAAQLVVSFRRQAHLRDATGDPWDGRLLEWATRSPPPPYNFARLPQVQGREPLWNVKEDGLRLFDPSTPLRPIALPRPSALPLLAGIAAGLGGFAMVWHIWWLAIVATGGFVALLVARGWQRETETILSPDEIRRIEAAA
jgi:cytochrome o ubiquinol oxidase subunit 1